MAREILQLTCLIEGIVPDVECRWHKPHGTSCLCNASGTMLQDGMAACLETLYATARMMELVFESLCQQHKRCAALDVDDTKEKSNDLSPQFSLIAGSCSTENCRGSEGGK